MQNFINIRTLGLCLGLALVPFPEAVSQDWNTPEPTVPEIMFREDAALSTSAVTGISGGRLAKTPTTNITSAMFGYGAGYYLRKEAENRETMRHG